MDISSYKFKEFSLTIGPHTFHLKCLGHFEKAVDVWFSNQGDNPSEATCPYYGALWPSAVALAKALVQGQLALPGDHCLEVGCGLALPSIVAAHIGLTATAADWHADAGVLLAENSHRNGAHVQFLVQDWSRDSIANATYPLILASDVLYDPTLAETLPHYIIRHLRPGGEFWLADPGRRFLERFVKSMEAAGFMSRCRTSREWGSEAMSQEIQIITFSNCSRLPV